LHGLRRKRSGNGRSRRKGAKARRWEWCSFRPSGNGSTILGG
jgi:hypothetical protein